MQRQLEQGQKDNEFFFLKPVCQVDMFLKTMCPIEPLPLGIIAASIS